MATTVPMPARGERGAPHFDKTKRREFPRFFTELEYLFQRSDIEAEADKKRHVLRYVDFETEQIWKTFPEYSTAAKTYEDFRDAILIHYPDATNDAIYSLRDMDLLIGEKQRVGIHTSADLADYHLNFTTITDWLINKRQLADLEQQRAYLRAFQPPFLAAIMNRLQIKFPDHLLSIPYPLKDVHEAAKFLLQSATTPQSYMSSLPTNPYHYQPNTVTPEPTKAEDFGSLFKEFTKTVLEALNSNIANTSAQTQETRNAVARAMICLFCGGPHPIRNCAGVDEYIKAGKCKRNIEGKIVLSTGAFIPRDTPGSNFRERIDEWHRRNPNQLAAATLIHTIDARILHNNEKPQDVYQLSSKDRIATLEAEIFNLRNRPNQASHVRTRAQKARAALNDEDSDDEDVEAARKAKQPQIVEVEEEETATPEPARLPVAQPKTLPASTSTSQPTQQPEHPYRSAKDATYQPPVIRNIGAPIKAAVKKPEATPKVLPPVYDPLVATNVYKRSMDAPIVISHRELLSLSPEVRAKSREDTTTRRVKDATVAQNLYQYSDDEQEDDYLKTLALDSNPSLPSDAIVISDPIETYYKSLRPGEEPDFDALIIAKESGAVRSVIALIDNTQRAECILDPGCQIIAISENLCHELSLAYDPSIKLNMQSANGNIDQSLGLSRNVPFKIHNITVYMQAHVIRSPAYDVLLGRPFDILTESIVRNFANEDQTITIHDPNTGNRVTIPTIARGPAKCTQAIHRHQHKPLPVFRRPGA